MHHYYYYQGIDLAKLRQDANDRLNGTGVYRGAKEESTIHFHHKEVSTVNYNDHRDVTVIDVDCEGFQHEHYTVTGLHTTYDAGANLFSRVEPVMKHKFISADEGLDETLKLTDEEASSDKDGQFLYSCYDVAMTAQNCEISPWEELDSVDQHAWVYAARCTH